MALSFLCCLWLLFLPLLLGMYPLWVKQASGGFPHAVSVSMANEGSYSGLVSGYEKNIW